VNKPDEERIDAGADVKPGGCCYGDAYASLPAELRPKLAANDDGLRHVTCPKCGLIYWTNRKTDICIHCE